MKNLSIVLAASTIILSGCTKENIPLFPNAIDCSTFIPFYELQDTTSTSLFIECDCLDNNINLASVLSEYKNVQDLDFDCNASWFDEIPDMPSVERLISNVTTPNLFAFQNLKEFRNKSFSNQQLATQLSLLPNLKQVTLFNAMNFPSYFMENKTLDVFKMTFQDTEEHNVTLPSNLTTISSLKDLNIIDLNIALFTNFDLLEDLEYLTVINTSIGRIPQSTDLWPKLKSLELSNVSIRGAGNLPDTFGHMDSLKVVYIEETRVTTTTQQRIYKAPNLRELTFSFCELSTIDAGIGNLSSLESLIISRDQSGSIAPLAIPQSLGTLTNLKTVYLSTGASEFPTVIIGLKATLESLGVSDNIGSVPASIGDFVLLKELSLANCGLSNLPSSIQNLANTLITLDLSDNSFSQSTRQQLASWLPNTQIIY